MDSLRVLKGLPERPALRIASITKKAKWWHLACLKVQNAALHHCAWSRRVLFSLAKLLLLRHPRPSLSSFNNRSCNSQNQLRTTYIAQQHGAFTQSAVSLLSNVVLSAHSGTTCRVVSRQTPCLSHEHKVRATRKVILYGPVAAQMFWHFR